ncbi:hypothetical protein BKA64DRAFT_393873 [Cadophora sp. MPI-SDFR-AT-0126]|nr:hypothetical protein BKA64DRAFT_393873 [Leotiomycetes sp. MPI-SDFR-AT-0126]
MAEALRVVGLAEKAASVLDTVKQKARGAANPRTTATSLSAAEEFRNWARESSVAECRSPDEEQHRDFVPIPLVRQYFKDNDYARLRRILDELDDDLTKYNIGLRTIFDEYLQVMCILIEIREVETLGSLIQHKINDQQLPVDQDKNAFSTVFEPKTWKLFIEHQWRYCVPEFDSQMINTHFQHGCVLPIVSTEMIGQGATATTFKMQIHPLYDSFERISSFQNENTANTYALKSFFARDSKYYLSEIDTYQKLAQSGNPSLVHYYGSYEQDDTYNIVLELADRGSLEQYLSYCQPPTAGLDIIQFWQSLFKIVWGLVCIHEVGGSPYLRGVHSNIKPATILVRDNSLGSQYGWEFKLGGLGNCKFSSNGNFPIKSALTYSYGSPECYLKGQEPSVNFNQNFDIWSLGCIFSEVAVWVASGYHGVQNYRILRATEADHELGDCFHNGKLVLGAVGTAHLQLLSNLRQSDVITAAIVRLVVARMMVPSAHRMTAKQLWQECQGILSQSKATLELEKDKAVLLTAPLNPDRDPRLVRDQQQSNIDTASDMFLTRQDQGITEGSQWSLRSDHSNHVVDKMSLPIRQSQQSSAQFQSSDSPGNINSGYESMPALSERPYSQNSRLASFGRIRPIPKHPKYEVPYLSVKQALQWKEHVQSQGRIGLGSRVKLRYGSSSEELPHSYLGERLRGRKIVFLIDNAATMGAHWPELTRLVGLLAYIAKSDNDIEMFSNHSQQPLKSKKSTTLVKYLERREFVPISAIVTKLKEVFDAYVIELQKEPSVKPMSLYVFSDGLWEPLSDVKSPIHDILQYLRHNYMPIGQVAIQFIRFGHSLSQLDDIKGWDRISGRYDFMDTEHSDGNVWKMLLGAIDLEFESDYDLGETKETVVQNPQTSLRPPEEQVDGYLEEHYKRLRPPLSSPDGSIFTELSQDVTNPLLSHGPDMPIPDLDQIRKSLPLGPTSHVESPPFHDSGYEGSTERQLSLIAKSTHENSFEANHSLPDTQGELNKVGHVESGDGNDTFTEVAVAQDQKYDIRSIISDDLDIQSRRSSKVTYQERLAEENLGYLLARHPQLKPLSEEALHRVGKIRFVDNLRRLLKGYYIDLRPIATTKLEIATVNLLRSRYSRARLSQQISDILDPEIDEMDDHEVRKAAITRQELERWVVGNPEFVSPREPFDDLNVEIDDSSSDDEQVVQKATTSRGKTPEVTEEPNLPNITQMESFLLTCGGGGPFQRLSTHLRIFLLPPTLGPLVRIMMSLPAECVWLDDQEDASLSNKLKAFVEDMTEEKWNWWPLRPRMRPLGKDQMRLNWVCVSLKLFFGRFI